MPKKSTPHRLHRLTCCSAIGLVLAACGGPETTEPDPTSPVTMVEIAASDDFQTTLQTALIEAEEGQTIQLPAGNFVLNDGLSLDVASVTIKGAGEGETILDFSAQTGAGEGLLVTADDVTLTGFTMRNTAGDGIKSKGADRISYLDLTVEWTGGPNPDNGAYGVYPVESIDVLVDGVTVRGASDAGIYVGQSRNIIVRNSLVEYNVAGIEIENSIGADVYDNVATNNTGGVLVFDLPDLPQVGGHSTRIFRNRIENNNTDNFAPPGNIVATVPAGTGVIVLANENVHVFENQLTDNQTAHILLTAYQDDFSDERYNPLPRNILIKGNTYSGGGSNPQGDLAPLAAAVGGQLPAIVWDGVTRWPGAENQTVNLMIDEPEEIGFLSLGFGTYPLDPANLAPTPARPAAEAIAPLTAISLAQNSQ